MVHRRDAEDAERRAVIGGIASAVIEQRVARILKIVLTMKDMKSMKEEM